MRSARLVAFVCVNVMLVASSGWCDNDWVEGRPDLEQWPDVTNAQRGTITQALDWLEYFPKWEVHNNVSEGEILGWAPLDRVPTAIKSHFPETVHRLHTSKLSITVGTRPFPKLGPRRVNGCPTAEGSGVSWQREGLTFSVKALAVTATGAKAMSFADAAYAVACSIDGGRSDYKITSSTVYLFDTSEAMGAFHFDRMRHFLRVHAGNSASWNRAIPDDAREWALMTFDGNGHRIQHGLVTVADKTLEAAERLRLGAPSGDDHLAKAVAFATYYLQVLMSSESGRVHVFSNGWSQSGGRDAIRDLNSTLVGIRRRGADPDPDPAASRVEQRGSVLLAPAGLPGGTATQADGPQYLGTEGETLEQLLARVNAQAARSRGRISVSVVGVGVEAGSEAEGLLKSIAESGGGQYHPGRTEEELAAAAQAMAPAPAGAPAPQPPAVAQPPAGGGGGVQAGGDALPNTMGSLVICRDVANNEAVDPTDTFGETSKICAVWQHPDVEPGSVSIAVWMRDGAEYTRSDQVLDGAGTATYWVTSNDPGGHPKGRYRLEIRMGGKTVASRQFTVGARVAPDEDPQGPVDGEAGGPDSAEDQIDLIIHEKDGTEIIEVGKLTAFNGVYFTLTNEDGMPVRVLKEEATSVLVGGAGEAPPRAANADTIALSDGMMLRGELVEFADGEWTIRKADGTTTKLPRSRVRAIGMKLGPE